jgi:hypothetical protein
MQLLKLDGCSRSQEGHNDRRLWADVSRSRGEKESAPDMHDAAPKQQRRKRTRHGGFILLSVSLPTLRITYRAQRLWMMLPAKISGPGTVEEGAAAEQSVLLDDSPTHSNPFHLLLAYPYERTRRRR